MEVTVDRPRIPDTAQIVLRLVDGAHAPDIQPFVRLRDGSSQLLWSGTAVHAELIVTVPFFNNFRDAYTILVTADGHRDVGFSPVQANPAVNTRVDLMLLPRDHVFAFLEWPRFRDSHPRAAAFLCCAGDEAAVEERYGQLRVDRPLALASLLNLTAAMSAIQLPAKTPLDYFKALNWDATLAQDRFFGWADKELLAQVRTAASQKTFAPEPNPGLFHPGATSSFKQIQFGEANVQLTFHEDTTKIISGVECIQVEPDIDYFKDLAAHTLLEVVSNKFSHGLSDPLMIYVLRWVAGQRAGIPEFDPGYTVRSAADITRTLTMGARS